MLAANPTLRGVAQMAVGYDNVDVEAATELGLPVTNTPGVLTDTTADLTWALLMAVARRVPEAERYMLGGRYKLWGPNLLLGADVSPGGFTAGARSSASSATAGLAGRWRSARLGFDMEVLAHNRSTGTASRRTRSPPGRSWASCSSGATSSPSTRR